MTVLLALCYFSAIILNVHSAIDADYQLIETMHIDFVQFL